MFANAQDRINKGYHEVCFGYLLAKFAALQQQELGGCIAGIGMYGPAFCNGTTLNKFDLVSVRNWLGTISKTDDSGKPITSGKGLLGNPYLVGCTAAKLNQLCAEYATGQGFRMPGFFDNDEAEYDGGVNFDRNNRPIDIGAYLLVWGDWAFLANRYSYQYAGNLAAVVLGRLASLDEKSALTYKTR